MIRRVGRSVGRAVFERVGRAAGRVQESKPLPADVLESDEGFLVVFDAPGASMTDVQVRFVDGSVLVRIDRFREFYEGYEMRFPGRGLALDGRADLPDGASVDAGSASAVLKENGTLHVEIPKAAAPTDAADATDAESVETRDV